MVAYYNGKLNDSFNHSEMSDVQFQITANINLTEKRFYFKFINFDNNYGNEYQFNLFDNNDVAV